MIDQPGVIRYVPQSTHEPLLGARRPPVAPDGPVHVILGRGRQVAQRVHLTDDGPQPVVDVPARLRHPLLLAVRLEGRVVAAVLRAARPNEVGGCYGGRSQTPPVA